MKFLKKLFGFIKKEKKEPLLEEETTEQKDLITEDLIEGKKPEPEPEPKPESEPEPEPEPEPESEP